jgi:hypothetical protein
MTVTGSSAPVYHVVLIGVDAYPAGFNSLAGCVNDIDAIEGVLFDPPGIGLAPDQIRLTRLAAPGPNATPRTRFAAETRLPTHDAIRDALLALAGPDVQPGDRVLIYYSGHGDQKQLAGSLVWHEALVPCDVQYLYDFEFNALLRAIAARTSDLTVILDSCHSGGATREDVDPAKADTEGAARLLASGNTLGQPPDPALAALARDGGDRPASLVQSLDPPYLALVACQSNEKAREKPFDGVRHGVLTYTLVQALNTLPAAERGTLRWADLWTRLLDQVNAASPTQHPWLIGRAERRVFGGRWDRQDPGYPVSRNNDGSYRIAAGRLLGLSAGARVAVYGPTPSLFPLLDSTADLAARKGLLQVTAAERSEATAQPVGAAFDLPGDARGRLVQPGPGERLRVLLDPPEDAVATFLDASPLLAVVRSGTPDAPDAEVTVRGSTAQGWIISNDVEPRVAGVIHGARGGLRAGLESYARYNQALRVARNANDLQLQGCLTLRLLDCTDAAALAAADPSDPALPEAPRDADRVYALPDGFRACLVVANTYRAPLFVTVLNATATGLIQVLGDVTLQPGDHQTIWKGAAQRVPFNMRPGAGRAGEVDRLLVIGTTRPGVSLTGLRVDHTVQEVVDVNSRLRGEPRNPGPPGANAPAELWTALTVPVRIGTIPT